MLALSPINQYLDQLLAYTHAYTHTTRVNPTTPTPTVSRLWLKLSFAPVEIICSVLDNDPEPTGTDEPRKLANQDWLLENLPPLDPEPLDEPVNIIDLAKARQQRQNRIDYSQGQHLHPRQRAIIQALTEAGFEYCGIDDELEGMEDGLCLGGFGISEEFDFGYWIAVQNLESLDTWGFPLDEENQDMSEHRAVNIIGKAIADYDSLDQIPLDFPESKSATVPANYIPPIPPDAFTIAGSTGRFAIAETDGGHLVGRWVVQKKGEKFSRHYIPNDGNCDCKAAQLGHNCCHSKALEHYQYQKKEQARIERERERDRLELLNKNRYQVFTGTDTDAGSFSSELHAIAKLEVLSYQGFDVKIYDRVEDRIIRSYTQPKLAAS